MANQKISALNSATITDGTEVLPVVQSAETKKMAVSVIKDYLLSVAGTFTNKTITGGTVNPTTLQEGGVAAVIQTDIGSAPNKIPLNQYLGKQAYLDVPQSSSSIVGMGYVMGAGSTVTQATSRTTGVTINTPTGQITLVSAAGSTSYQTFTVTNASVAATDVIKVCQASGTDLNIILVTNVAAGSFKISFATTGGTTTEQPVFNFAVIKGSAV